MKKRNNFLEDFYHLNQEVVDSVDTLSDDLLSIFYKRREALLKFIDNCDNQISSLSMCNWDRFKFEPAYKSEYVSLSMQKKKLITGIIDQDLFIMSKVGISFVEKIA